MSLITDYIIVVQDPDYLLSSEPEDLLFDEFQAALYAKREGAPSLFKADEAHCESGHGPKAFTSACWIGAGNFFTPDTMLEVIGENERFQRHLLVLCNHENHDDGWRLLWSLNDLRKCGSHEPWA